MATKEKEAVLLPSSGLPLGDILGVDRFPSTAESGTRCLGVLHVFNYRATRRGFEVNAVFEEKSAWCNKDEVQFRRSPAPIETNCGANCAPAQRWP